MRRYYATEALQGAAPTYAHLLTAVLKQLHASKFNHEYDVHGICNPFLQVKVRCKACDTDFQRLRTRARHTFTKCFVMYSSAARWSLASTATLFPIVLARTRRLGSVAAGAQVPRDAGQGQRGGDRGDDRRAR